MDTAPFTWRGLRAGVRGGVTPATTSFVYGLAFGLLADQAGLALGVALAMSALVYSGSAQLVALQAWGDPVPVLTVCAAILAINSRYILVGASLRPWLAGLPPHKTYLTLFFLAEANWAPAMREYRSGGRDAAFLLGSGALMYAAWVSSTGIGHALGRAVDDPRKIGLDFLLPAFFAMMAVALWRGRHDILPFGVAAVVALLVDRLAGGHWYILAGGIAGSLAAAWRSGRDA